MTTVAIERAQKDLPDLMRRALKGEEILIASEDQKTSVRLLPAGFDEAVAARRGYGLKCLPGRRVMLRVVTPLRDPDFVITAYFDRTRTCV